jgi:transcriptional regulator with XRE-family HTH domain
MAEVNAAIKRLGRIVADYRMQLGRQQNQIAALVKDVNRTVIAYLEEGRALPPPEQLEEICVALKIPRRLWYPATHESFVKAMEFQNDLSELLGKSVSLEHLDDMSGYLAVDAVSQILSRGMSSEQAHAHFNSILTFYGERPVTTQFFRRFLGHDAFIDNESFSAKVRNFQRVAIRVYGSFRQAFQTLRCSTDIDCELRVLDEVNETQFTQRRPFDSIRSIPPERLDDLGYISVDRVRKESRERHELHEKLEQLARALRQSSPSRSSESMSVKRIHRVQTLLRRFGSQLEVGESLFSAMDPEELEREAKKLAPADAELARIEETQDRGRRNLAAYLTEPHMDVYVATSMREKADFISVDNFVEALFKDPEIAHLHLRYFNPTQSWIEDRVAKGLVEALMLRRARLTVYMAQKTDTFGKDSEASVALGQGKPVIVYVPRLFDPSTGIDSESLMAMAPADLEKLNHTLQLDDEEGIDAQSQVTRILSARLGRLAPADAARIFINHWADFDLIGELANLKADVRDEARKYLDRVVAWTATDVRPEPTEPISRALFERLVAVAVRFENRARTFREIHPLALQVILSTGVLNGIVVVRSALVCAKVMHRLLTNTIQTELLIDDNNYKLIEKTTRSTLRVISKNRLLVNAFWTQYFPES